MNLWHSSWGYGEVMWGVKCCTGDPWKLSPFVLLGKSDEELSCHKENSTEHPSHIKGVAKRLRNTEKYDRMRGWWKVFPDLGMRQVSEHLIKCLQGQLFSVTLPNQSKLALILWFTYKSIHLAGLVLLLVYNSGRIRNNLWNEYIFLAVWCTLSWHR